MTGYVTLASAWALFSGRTGYVSLATVAFFGIGAYAVAVLSETLPYPLVLLTAAASASPWRWSSASPPCASPASTS